MINQLVHLVQIAHRAIIKNNKPEIIESHTISAELLPLSLVFIVQTCQGSEQPLRAAEPWQQMDLQDEKCPSCDPLIQSVTLPNCPALVSANQQQGQGTICCHQVLLSSPGAFRSGFGRSSSSWDQNNLLPAFAWMFCNKCIY